MIYDDSLRDLLNEGPSVISRASHVEPVGLNWYATMQIGGMEEVLGPFNTRQEALDAEVEYLKEQLFK